MSENARPEAGVVAALVNVAVPPEAEDAIENVVPRFFDVRMRVLVPDGVTE